MGVVLSALLTTSLHLNSRGKKKEAFEYIQRCNFSKYSHTTITLDNVQVLYFEKLIYFYDDFTFITKYDMIKKTFKEMNWMSLTWECYKRILVSFQNKISYITW